MSTKKLCSENQGAMDSDPSEIKKRKKEKKCPRETNRTGKNEIKSHSILNEFKVFPIRFLYFLFAGQL